MTRKKRKGKFRMPQPQQPEKLSLVPVRVLNQTLDFIVNHPGITMAQCRTLVEQLERFGNDGIELAKVPQQRITELEAENASLHQKLEEIEKRAVQ